MDERTFFQQGDVKVTSARFIKGGQTYAMSNITSVKAFKEPPKRTGGYFVATISLFITLSTPGVGIPMLAVALLYLYKQKTTYHVMLSTAGGESSALSTDHKEYVEDVVEAVNKAIVHRG